MSEKLTIQDALRIARDALVVRADHWNDMANINALDIEHVWASSVDERVARMQSYKDAAALLASADEALPAVLPAELVGVSLLALSEVGGMWSSAAHDDDVPLEAMRAVPSAAMHGLSAMYRAAYLAMGELA